MTTTPDRSLADIIFGSRRAIATSAKVLANGVPDTMDKLLSEIAGFDPSAANDLRCRLLHGGRGMSSAQVNALTVAAVLPMKSLAGAVVSIDANLLLDALARLEDLAVEKTNLEEDEWTASVRSLRAAGNADILISDRAREAIGCPITLFAESDGLLIRDGVRCVGMVSVSHGSWRVSLLTDEEGEV